ncbi:hypothetical protein V5O48_006007 [Marasmius crinis-equi]|uniref:Uncharacterized protein n=1 Tax=Marasmius crinis-equi TaxID=585013 RepID=A0ABR3FKX6_9AGAR
MFMTKFGDYFSIPRRKTASHHVSPHSPIWNGRPPASPTLISTISATKNSRGSWAGLLNSANVLQLVQGVHDSPRDPLSPSEGTSSPTASWARFSNRSFENGSPIPRHTGPRRDSGPTSTSKSWGETFSSSKGSVSFSEEHRLPARISGRATRQNSKQNVVVFHEQLLDDSNDTEPVLDKPVMESLVRHAEVYAEILFRWASDEICWASGLSIEQCYPYSNSYTKDLNCSRSSANAIHIGIAMPTPSVGSRYTSSAHTDNQVQE